MRIVHTYINNMYIDPCDENKDCFANRWGLVSLAKLGHEVTLVCGGEGRKRKEYVWNKIRVIELPILFGINNTSRILSGFIKELKHIEADVLHTHHYSSFIPEITLVIGKMRRIPTFVTFHNTFLEGNFLRKILGFFYLLGMQPFLPFYDRVFFISNYVKKKLYFQAANGKIVYNQIDVPPKLNRVRKKNSLLFIGRITHQKGIDLLLESLVKVRIKFPDISLDIAGDGSPNYIHFLRKKVQNLNLKEQVRFLGKVKGDHKWEQYYNHQILVVPSRDEGFGNVVVEGMLCGIPVIVSNRGALYEASGKNAALFKQFNSSSLSEKILFLLENSELSYSISKKYPSYASKFTKNNLVRTLINCYQK